MENCKFCSKECKNLNSLRNHERLCKLNPDKKKYKSNFLAYNEKVRKGEVVKENSNQFVKARKLGLPVPEVSDETRSKISKKIIERAENDYWTKERCEKHSKAMRKAVKRSPESYSANNVCGRTKLIEYNGFKLNGKWELEVAKWLDKNNIQWTNKIKEGFKYIWNHKEHLYFPDFYLIDYDLYIEVKGYERERDRCKWKVIDNLIILKQKEIKQIKEKKFTLAHIASGS